MFVEVSTTMAFSISAAETSHARSANPRCVLAATAASQSKNTSTFLSVAASFCDRDPVLVRGISLQCLATSQLHHGLDT